MRTEVIIPIILAFPIGLLFFTALIKNVSAHLRSWKDKISFFFWPYPPSRMLIIQELDGEINIYYDNDFEEIQSENRTLIKTIDGQQYVTEIPPSESSITVSIFDAKAPAGIQSPFGVGWRWIVAAAIMIYFIYYALVTAWIPPIEVVTKVVHGIEVSIAQQAPLDPWEALLVTVVFFSVLTWYLSNIMRMNDRTIQYAWYHAKGINPPHIAIVPVPGISTTGLLEYLEKLGRKIEIVIPKEVEQTINKVISELEKKTGSKSLAAVILAKLAMAKTWRQALANILRERFDMRKAGEAAAIIRLGLQPVTKKVIPIAIIVFLIGIAVGYAIGNAFSFGIAPATNTTATTPTTPTLSTQSITTTITTTQQQYTPAPPPPPPLGGKP